MNALAAIALVLGSATLVSSLGAVLRAIARGSNGGYSGFIAAAVSLVGGVLTTVLAVVLLFAGVTRLGLIALALGLGSPLLIIALILFFVPKSAFRL